MKAAGPEQELLVVAQCTGARCAALHRLAQPGAQPSEVLREAVRARPNGLLVSVGCLGACARGSLAVVGEGISTPGGGLAWSCPPALVGLLDDPGRMRLLASWVREPGSGPLPPALRRDETG